MHADLPARVGALLLWLTGYEADETAASELDPGIDRTYDYDKDYLPNSGGSWFRVERRHARGVLCDASLPLHRRLSKTQELWLDPTFEPPPELLDEVRNAAGNVRFDELHRRQTHTPTDSWWDELQPVLARLDPARLAEVNRQWLAEFTSCPPDQRYWAAIHTHEPFILANDATRAAVQHLRLSASSLSDPEEAFAAAKLLMLEVKGRDALDQARAIIDANLEYIQVFLADTLQPLDEAVIDQLLDLYGDGSAKQRHDLLILISITPAPPLSPRAWTWVERFAFGEDGEDQHVAFQVLTAADAERFGRSLASRDWTWSASAHVWINQYGSDALVRATLSSPFDSLAPKLAPWRLLAAARVRGAQRAEVALATEIVSRSFLAEKLEAPDPGADLAIDLTKHGAPPFSFSISLRRQSNDDGDMIDGLERAFDPDRQLQASRRAAEVAIGRIQDARAGGADLYLAEVDADDIAVAVASEPVAAKAWMDGVAEVTADFRRRVRLAERFYLSLCEVLLTSSPEEGAMLWRALRKTLTITFIGEAGVDELVHLPFRAPSSPAVDTLRDLILELGSASTDEALWQVALAAGSNGQGPWLERKMVDDAASELPWRRKRAIVLGGLRTDNTLPMHEAWPEGPSLSSTENLRLEAARRRWAEACARHWWRVFLKAEDAETAYAAWILHLNAADRRADNWRAREFDARRPLLLEAFKAAHYALNIQDLRRRMSKRMEKLDRKLFSRDIGTGLYPWLG